MTALNINVIASSDDAEELNAPAVPNLTSSDLDFYLAPTPYVGIRFQNVTIPANATIISAVIRLTANSNETGLGHSQTIYCQDVDDAPTFTTDSGNISTRVTTTASVVWTPGATTAETQYDTADFAAVLQEVIDRPGWTSGQDIAVLFADPSEEDGPRHYYSYDHGSDVPQLRITYGEIHVGYALVF